VSATGWDFWHSRNRIVTYKINGWVSHFLKDTNYTLTLPLLFFAQKGLDGSYSVWMQLMPGGGVETSGYVGHAAGDRDWLKAAIERHFAAPILVSGGNWHDDRYAEKGFIPVNAFMLSLKVMQDGGMTVFLERARNPIPDRWQAPLQHRLNEMADGRYF
jgi:hypothetical protein